MFNKEYRAYTLSLSKPVRLAGVNGCPGLCRFLALGSVSFAICLVGVRKIPDGTVMP